MSISENIRKSRKKAGYTQETLAEKLNVSVSAVSQWESGKTIPDITLIPTLCHLFQISSDVLLDINLNNDKEVMSILLEAGKFSDEADFEEAEKILSKGLLRFPNSYPIMTELMYMYYRIYLECGEEKKKQYEYALISICNQIVDGCPDGENRARAVQILCLLYAEKKEYAKAKNLAYKMPPMDCCRQALLTNVTTGEEKIHRRKTERYVLLHRLCELMLVIGGEPKDEECEYSPDEQAVLREKLISLIQLMFEKGDFASFSDYYSRACAWQAEYYALKKNSEKTIEYLEEAKKHAIAIDNYTPNEKHTSLVFRGEEYGDIGKNTKQKAVEWVSKFAMREEFDFIRPKLDKDMI